MIARTADMTPVQRAARRRHRVERLHVLIADHDGLARSMMHLALQESDRIAMVTTAGDEELARGVVAMKPLRQESGQTECPRSELASRVEELLVRLANRPSG